MLRAAIVGLDFAPGEFIDKGAVCERLRVSRFPVSEALGRLAAEGLVEVLPQRGTRAARIRLGEVREAMMIRRALEAMVAETAARHLPDDALDHARPCRARAFRPIGVPKVSTRVPANRTSGSANRAALRP